MGEHSDYMLSMLATDADVVVAAWGQPSGIRPACYRRRVEEVTAIVGADRINSLETTAAGHPKHPQVWASPMVMRDWNSAQVQW